MKKIREELIKIVRNDEWYVPVDIVDEFILPLIQKRLLKRLTRRDDEIQKLGKYTQTNRICRLAEVDVFRNIIKSELSTKD